MMRELACTRSNTTGGYTLIELIVVLVVVGLASVMAMPFVRPQASRVEMSAKRIASAAQTARLKAISTGREASLELDPNIRGIRVDGVAEDLVLSKTTSVEFQPAAGIDARQPGYRTIFYPDGSSTGGAFILKDQAKVIIIQIDWLTGTVNTASR